jgi:hypothetical protein
MCQLREGHITDHRPTARLDRSGGESLGFNPRRGLGDVPMARRPRTVGPPLFRPTSGARTGGHRGA